MTELGVPEVEGTKGLRRSERCRGQGGGRHRPKLTQIGPIQVDNSQRQAMTS
jgi:hypothetical protein